MSRITLTDLAKNEPLEHASGQDENFLLSQNHPRQSPTIHACCSYFPVLGSPTATIEVVGNTGTMSSEKAGVGGSTPNPGTAFSGSACRISCFAQEPTALFIRRQIPGVRGIGGEQS